MVEVYHEPLARRYYASRFSCAYFFFLLVGLVAIVVPFFLAYTNVPSFWLKTNTYREQPKVAFQYKIVFSSMADVENLYSGELRVPTLRSIELDLNRDGMADQFHLTALIPLRKGERVLHADLVTFYDVKLRRRARVHMDALAYSSGGGGGMAGKALYVDGDTLMPNIFYGYRNRNNTMDYHELYKVWSPAPPPIDGPFGVREEFNFTMVMRIPEMEILYTPTASEVLKDAWIKYLALFVVVKYLLEKLCAFVFYNQLVDTTMRVETAQHRSGVKATSL
ncbi:hypothetical protein JL721_4780 [Aureococcus anophagefferens]|nr:hypothetical protein JL721_4780 [Aureococcus anophagefferens]